ncbi:MAG: UDP-N-acetylglucosamine diphosphorylase/glucosamine-1-phosphate N-acetyltransferase [Gammaproteobacteria bacterium]|nr:MAG: UDP-N-acetylglucosamine diphosphorylase/glucosamine-1-phosphate N-acetyltransferase [Gammaproteobacteria bacterium]
MRSRLPKVLHPLAGRPLLAHVLDTARALSPEIVLVVHGHGGEQVRRAFAQAPVAWVDQGEPLGTGHAVAQALPQVPDGHRVLVLYGDVPLLGAETLRRLLAAAGPEGVALLTAELADPSGYGRILRDGAGRVQAIVEERDASAEQRALREVNTGVLTAPAHRLRRWLARVDNRNAQGEYYLTDVVALAVLEGVPVHAVPAPDPEEVLGVNDRLQLAALERRWQRRAAERLLREGVGLLDPARFDLRGELRCGLDVVLDVGVVVEGRVELGDGVRVGPYVLLRDVRLGPGCEVLAHSVLEGVEAGPGVRIGPFARLRPGTRLAAGARVGNFVELKAAEVGEGSKINHLSYVGDATVGRAVNIGAGTITCNYDGHRKHRTVIEDEAFIGSDTQLVAPVRVGRGATIGAGSTITRDAPPGELTLSRAPQVTRQGWRRPAERAAAGHEGPQGEGGGDAQEGKQGGRGPRSG